jgi:cephalosporin hydroxylase
MTNYAGRIPNDSEFRNMREKWINQMSKSNALREQAIELSIASSKFSYGYQWEWCGVPIIRHPDDIVLQQEIMWCLKPSRVIETGVARGGSLVLSSSLMKILGKESKVLGIDIEIHTHALDSLMPWTENGDISLIEADSTSKYAQESVHDFVSGVTDPVLLILDSNHTHSHVLDELMTYSDSLPINSIIMVADTIVEEMPEDFYPDRPWGRGNNPMTAVREFLSTNSDWSLDLNWSRRSLLGECRDGIIVKNGLAS